MPKMRPEDPAARVLVRRFGDYVLLRLKIPHYTFHELFGEQAAVSLMERTARGFFGDLEDILKNYWWLEVAKLTDPQASLGAENFSLDNLMATIDWPPACLAEIGKLRPTIDAFRDSIKPARNKLLAHYDKKTVTTASSLGGFAAGEDEKLLNALERICNLMHEASFGQILGEMVPSYEGDVLDLKKALAKAIVFDILLEESKGELLLHMSQLLGDVLEGRR